jgi:hypothetical protein
LAVAPLKKFLQASSVWFYKNAQFAKHMLPIRPMDRDQVEIEARAKTFWGDSRDEVVKYIMMQGVSAGEATELADGLFVERAQIIRAAGVKKIIIGIPLMALPVVLWFVFLATIRFVPIKLWALTLMAGLYGMYCLFKGLIMFFSPKSEPGDCSEK